MRILVTGAEGMLGRAVTSFLAAEHAVAPVDLADGDLAQDGVAARLLRRHRAEWVIHTAAYTDVDRAESLRERALAVNGTATAALGIACQECGAGLTFISTDYVFAGQADSYDENAEREPINHYGWTKAQGEEAVEALRTPWQIVRTSWLFGPGPRNFVLTVRRLLNQNGILQVVDDQRGCPTYTPDLAAILSFLVRSGQTGRYHGTNRGACSWHEFAQEIARLSGEDPTRVKPCPSSAYPTPARRPSCSVLASHNLESLGYSPRPTWQDALRRYIQWLDAAPSTGTENRDLPRD